MKIVGPVGQGHTLTFDKISYFDNVKHLLKSPPWRIVNKFHIEPQGVGGTKTSSDGSGHMTYMAVNQIVLNLKNSSSPEQIN